VLARRQGVWAGVGVRSAHVELEVALHLDVATRKQGVADTAGQRDQQGGHERQRVQDNADARSIIRRS
jgi:hypothetical protein